MSSVPYHEASIHAPPPKPSKWGPYSGAGEFSVNMVVALIILFCALFLALAVSAIVRYLFCANRRLGRRRRRQDESSDPEKPSLDKAVAPAAESAPALTFSAGAKLAGAGPAECAICLLEFADGDRVRVLPACEHGFHAGCIERWLRTKSSCPTCRTSFQQVVAGPAVAAAGAG